MRPTSEPTVSLWQRPALRWLAYLLDTDPEVEPIRQVMRRRLMYQPMIDAELRRLTKMLVTLGQFSGTGPFDVGQSTWTRLVSICPSAVRVHFS